MCLKGEKMRKTVVLMFLVLLPLAMLLAGCESQNCLGNTVSDSDVGDKAEMKMIVNVNGTEFKATFENNNAAEALGSIIESNPLELVLRDYGGFEKVGSLGFSLPSSNRQITTHSGDIVLYQGNQIVMFYGSNSWSYTKLAHIDDLRGWEETLGRGDVRVLLSLDSGS